MFNLNSYVLLMKRKNKLFLLFMSFISVLAIIYLVYQLEYVINTDFETLQYLKKDPRTGIHLFYVIHDSGFMIYLFALIMAILPNVVINDFLAFNNNHFYYSIISRTGYKKYQIETILFNFITVFIFILSINLFILIIIHIFCFPLTNINQIDGSVQYANILGTDVLTNLIIFLLLSSLGYALFSTFIFSLQCFIKNIYVFKACGLIVGILMYVAPTLASGFFSLNIKIPFLARLVYFFNLPNLISPGIIFNGFLNDGALIFYLGSFIVYFLLSVFLFRLRENIEYE